MTLKEQNKNISCTLFNLYKYRDIMQSLKTDKISLSSPGLGKIFSYYLSSSWVLVLGGNNPSSMKTLVASTLFLLSMASSEKNIRESSNFLLGASLESGTADSVGTSLTACGASVVTVSAISVWISSTSVASIGWSVVSSIIDSSVVSMGPSVVSSPDPSSSDTSIPTSTSSISVLSTGSSILSFMTSGFELIPGRSDSSKLGSSSISFSETLAVSIDVFSQYQFHLLQVL